MIEIVNEDCREFLRWLPDDTFHCVVTSPPYWGLRDYGVAGQIGLEPEFPEFVEQMVAVFREIRRVLRPDGTCWLNLGDCYATGAGKVGRHPGGGKRGENWGGRGVRTVDNSGKASYRIASMGPLTQPNRMPQPGLKPKDLVLMPSRVALALQDDGWWVRSEIVWHKPNPMPESIRDRPTSAHEKIFLLTKSERYHYDAEAVREPFADARQGRDGSKKNRQRDRGGREDGFTKPNGVDPSANGGRNLRNVWTIAPQPFKGAHFATFPPALVEPCIKAGCPADGIVLDPFGGAGTVGLVAQRLGRRALLIELNPDYAAMAAERIRAEAP